MDSARLLNIEQIASGEPPRMVKTLQGPLVESKAAIRELAQIRIATMGPEPLWFADSVKVKAGEE